MPSPRLRAAWPALLALPLLLAAGTCRHSAPTATSGGAKKHRAAKPQPTRAYVIDDVARCVKGPAAGCKLGDIRLDNGVISIVVDRLGRGQGFAVTGGYVVDATRTGGGREEQDLLNQVILYLNDTFPRQALFDQLDIVEAGGPGKTAIVRATGVDSGDAALKVVSEYRLAPGVPYLELHTTVTNSGEAALESYTIGDAFQWGHTEHWAPGYGYEFAGKKIRVPWLAGVGIGSSFGWTVKQGDLWGPNGSSWSDANGVTGPLKPGESMSHTRYLVLGDGDAASVSKIIYELRGEAVGTVRGEVREQRSGRPLRADVWVRELEQGRLLDLVRSDDKGRFEMSLPPGRYRFKAVGRERNASQTSELTLAAGETAETILGLTRAARLRFEILDVGGQALPGKLTFTGVDGTPDPELGPIFRAQGSRNVWLSGEGRGRIDLPPGSYLVHASRGPEYEFVRRRLDLAPGQEAQLSMTLKRSVDTAGYLSVDFHQHARNSFDSAVTLDDRVISNAAEGVEVLVSSDHNYVTDYRPVIRKLALEPFVTSIVGNEATTMDLGHFNAWPVKPRPDMVAGGAPDVLGAPPAKILEMLRAMPPAEGVSTPVTQINHPRTKIHGYFEILKLDPKTAKSPDPRFTIDFDAIEVLNGKRVKDAPKVLQDWYNLLNLGHRLVATGNSDTHGIYTYEAGFPRNWVRLDIDDPRQLTPPALVDAMRNTRDVTVSYGPFVTMRVAGQPVGSTVKLAGDSVKVEVIIRAASWATVDELTLVQNGQVVRRESLEQPMEGAPQSLTLPLEITTAKDAWVLAMVRGSRPMKPMVPTTKGKDLTPLAFTNPVWLDRDGNGKFDAPGLSP